MHHFGHPRSEKTYSVRPASTKDAAQVCLKWLPNHVGTSVGREPTSTRKNRCHTVVENKQPGPKLGKLENSGL